MGSPGKPPLDWRYRTVTQFTKPWKSPYTGSTYPAGTPVSKSTFVRHKGNELKIGDHSAPALYLDLSHKAYQQALLLHPFLKKWPRPKGKDPSRLAYDYLESMMSCITFAFTALEAWANEEIPDDYREERRKKSGLFYFLTKPAIERHASLSEKLSTILPSLKQVPAPKGLKVWDQYVQLKEMRDRIVHLKSADRAASKGNNLYPDSIWNKLLDPSQPNYPFWAKELILHFVPEDAYHWLKYCPIK